MIKQCVVCSGKFKLTSSRKKTCSAYCQNINKKRSMRKWREDNREYLREYEKRPDVKIRRSMSNRRNYVKNAEVRRQYARDYREQFPERYKESKRRSETKHCDKVRLRNREHSRKRTIALQFIRDELGVR